MFKRLGFAITYALRNLRRDRQRTAFAMLSIAAGVATVVALRMLGLMLTDALTSNVRGFLRGDYVVYGNARGPSISLMENNRPAPFAAKNIELVNQWAAKRNIEVTYTFTSELMQAAVV